MELGKAVDFFIISPSLNAHNIPSHHASNPVL
jgi:hypothetical protein